MSSNNFDRRILELVNQERSAAGLDPLGIDRQLDTAANLHTDRMVQADRMSHQLPGQAGLGDRVSNAGYDWIGLGENVAAGYTTPEAVVDGWMNSPKHRENILNSDFTDIGIGYENAPDNNGNFDDYDTYWTQVFGTQSNNSTLENNVDSNVGENNFEANPQNQQIDEINNFEVNPENKEIDAEDSNYDRRVLGLVNEARAEAGLDSLAIDSQLDRAADLHTDEMVQADRMSHQLPGEAGLGDRVTQTGYDWIGLGENVAAGHTTPEAVVDSWMNSPKHRENILDPNFTHMGVGYENAPDNISNSNDTDTYWTQVFGTEGAGI